MAKLTERSAASAISEIVDSILNQNKTCEASLSNQGQLKLFFYRSFAEVNSLFSRL
jgi:hypothetical protein